MEKEKLFYIEEERSTRHTAHKKSEWLEASFSSDINNHLSTFSNEFKRDEFLGLNIKQNKVKYLLFSLIFAFLIIVGKLFYLQIIKGDEYRLRAEGNRIRTKYINGLRGNIYDRNRKLLVRNIPTFSLFCIPHDLPKDTNIRLDNYNKINTILNSEKSLDYEADFFEKFEKLITKKTYDVFQPHLVAENINNELAMLLFIETAKIPGFFIDVESKREYLIDDEELQLESMSHYLGYLGRLNESDLNKIDKDKYLLSDLIGKSGLELYYEDILRGKKGIEQIEVNALGKPMNVISQKSSEQGYDVVMSIDYNVQREIEIILKEELKKLNLTKASVILLNPQNGEIISLISLPGYNINLFSQGISQKEYQKLINNEDNPLFHRSISGEYPSGSTFKIVVGAAALEDNIVSEYTVIKSGGIRINEWFFPDWKDGGHGIVSINRAISESVNTFFYYLSGGYENFRGLGVITIKDYAEKFGLSHALGIDLPAESKGLLPDPKWKEEVKGERWYIGDTYHLGIGQGDILVTPIQVATYTSFFANEGAVYKPFIVKEIYNTYNNTSTETQPEVLNGGFINKKNINIIKRGMKRCVNDGSCRILENNLYNVAGKTGTAQWHSLKEPHAWFTSFAPYDKPKYVLTILVEEGGEGSAVAAPIANRIYDYLYKYDNNIITEVSESDS